MSSMEIIKFNENHIDEVVDLWNRSCGVEMPYKPFTKVGFIDKFIDSVHFDFDSTLVGVEDGKLVGFASGVYKKEFLPGETYETTPGYLTFIIVDKNYRRKGLGTELLKKVENHLFGIGKKMIQVSFFNPINLEWYVPGTNGHDHPNAPGVDVDGPGYEFLKKNGYADRTKEVSMYLDLKEFELTEEIVERLGKLKAQGIEIEYYSSDKHSGFNELFDDLKHELWRKEIKDNISLEKPFPVIVSSDRGNICGFTGPVEVQRSGRGKFSGIGVDSKHQGLGIGKILFFMLCKAFKDEGAGFMSIFTGIENNAKRMYDAAGFKVVKTWAVLRKEI